MPLHLFLESQPSPPVRSPPSSALPSTNSHPESRVPAIIRSLCQPFEYLLLDEPFSHLDAENTKIACELINEELKAQKASLIMVSLGEKYDFQYDKELIL